MKDIAIFGAGGFGREVLLLLHQINAYLPTWNILGFYDDNSTTPNVINQYPYLGTLADLNAITNPLYVAVAIGDPRTKSKIINQITSDCILFPVLIHPGVEQQDFHFIQIGEGSIICQGNILTTNIKIGKHVIINLGCTIGHDAIIKDFCSLMPRVNMAGNTFLNQEVYVGTNATILPGLTIGENSVIGAGAVVTKPIPASCTAVGVPAKILQKDQI